MDKSQKNFKAEKGRMPCKRTGECPALLRGRHAGKSTQHSSILLSWQGAEIN